MQVDIGFGDIIYPGPEETDLPVMLDFPAPRLLCYSRESVIAEKFEAMVKLGILNSRMKDFYDIWLLARQFDFDGEKLAEAIRLTFQRRGTSLPPRIEAFEQPFIDTRQIQWSAFRKRLQQDHVPESFKGVVSVVEDFLAPLTSLLSHDEPKPLIWPASGHGPISTKDRPVGIASAANNWGGHELMNWICRTRFASTGLHAVQ